MFKFIEQINKHSYTLKWTKKVCAFIYPILESNHAIMAEIQGPNNYEYWIIELKQTFESQHSKTTKVNFYIMATLLESQNMNKIIFWKCYFANYIFESV